MSPGNTIWLSLSDIPVDSMNFMEMQFVIRKSVRGNGGGVNSSFTAVHRVVFCWYEAEVGLENIAVDFHTISFYEITGCTLKPRVDFCSGIYVEVNEQPWHCRSFPLECFLI